MTTQNTSGLNLLGSLFAAQPVQNRTSDVTDSFQSYVSVGRRNQSVSETDAQRQSETERLGVSHQDIYKAEGSQSERYETVTKSERATEVKEAGNQEASDEISKEELQELVSEMRSYLKDALGLDDKQLDDLLAQLNLNILQLLQPENLQGFLLTAMDKSPLDLVTDSTLTDLMQNVQNSLQELADAYGFDFEHQDTEQLAKLMEALPEKKKQATVGIEQTEPVSEQEQTDKATQDVDTGRTGENAGTKELSDGFRVQEEKTGIDVTVRTQSETGNQKESDSRKSGQDVAGGIINHLTQAVQEAGPEPMAFQADIQQTEIIQQIIEQIKVFRGNDIQKMEVQLYPEHLGKVQIQVAMKSGVMTAQITTETELAKSAIESQLVQLKETFEQQNLKVDAVEVSVAMSGFQSEQEKQDAMNQQDDRRITRKHGLRGLETEEESEDELEAELLQAQGASVEFQA